MIIKTRFAPSPTGYLHIGSIRTALFSWLFAKRKKGKFVFRIEDTDCKRLKKNSIKSIINSMKWLNIDWDEGPYFQTLRLKRYQSVINKMILNGKAYKCYCSIKRLENLRKKQILLGKKPKYDGFCKKNIKYFKNKNYVVRFNNPKTGSVIFKDIIRGKIEFKNKELDDVILQRTNGSFTYNFCVVIDDLDMKISHIIRGEDHINNTPRQINIMKSINAPIPFYAHLPIILNNNGKKLSKRDNSLNILKFKDEGFLPEALLNNIVRQGWSHKNKEIFSIYEMKKLFNLDCISKSSSFFNIKKLIWLNHFYIKNLPNKIIIDNLLCNLKKEKININLGPKIYNIVNILKQNCKTLKDMTYKCRYFYEDFKNFNKEDSIKYLNILNLKILNKILNKIYKIKDWNKDNIKNAIYETSYDLGVKFNAISMPLRVAVTGSKCSPSIDITIYEIGKIRSIYRIEFAINFIIKNQSLNNFKKN
ncbi:MAG: glutamate--tRNA ligase [Enterobacterales bacterium]